MQPLKQAVVECITFFGMCSDEQCNDDSAVDMLEVVSAILHVQSDVDKKEFDAYVKALAKHEESRSGKTQRVKFLKTLVKNLNIMD